MTIETRWKEKFIPFTRNNTPKNNRHNDNRYLDKNPAEHNLIKKKKTSLYFLVLLTCKM